jgi:hypothetical protein
MEQVFTRLCTLPHVASRLQDNERYVPLQSLLGPFTFPVEMFRRRLQNGSQQFGDFAEFPSDSRLRVTAFNYKKMLDLVLALFQRLRFSAKHLKVDRVFCMMDGVTMESVSETRDLSEAYEKVESFNFFFEVSSEEIEMEEEVMNEVDDIMDQMLEDNRNASVKAAARGGPELRKRKREAYFANRNECNSSYNANKESNDLSSIFTTPTDVGRMIEASMGQSHMVFKEQHYMKNCPFAFSKLFSVAKLHREGSARLRAKNYVQDPIHGTCLDVCATLSFSILSDDFSAEFFPYFGFPDIRSSESTFLVPLPEDASLSALCNLNIDRTVSVKNKASFQILRDRLRPALISLNQEMTGLTFEQKRTKKESFLSDVFGIFKGLFSEHMAISSSLRGLIEKWQVLDEIHNGIPMKQIYNTDMNADETDSQQKLLLYLYEVSEDIGIFCHHSTFIQVLLDSRWACQKMQTKAPHTILFGEPGTGKSHVLDMAKECLPRYLFEKVTNMSTLAWAVKNESDRQNPDEHLAQVALFFDEMQATLLGAENGGSKKDNAKGENTDRCAMFKEMLTAPTLSYRRNVEAKTKEGLSTRSLEKGEITCEIVIFAGMKRPPANINDAFQRRINMKACLFMPRKDGITIDDCKVKDARSKEEMLTRTDSLRQKHFDFLHTNADLQLILSLAEFVGITQKPNTFVWDKLVKCFKKAVLGFGTVRHLDDRLDDTKKRLELFLKMHAIKKVFQEENQLLSFDHIIRRLPLTEKFMVATEATCLAFFASLEEVVFPTMHKLVLFGIRHRYARELAEEQGDEEQGYVTLPVASISRKMDDDFKTIGKKSLQPFVYRETESYMLKKVDDLCMAAIEEMLDVMVGVDREAHAVLKVAEDDNGRIKFQVSRMRMENIHKDIGDVLGKCLHRFSPRKNVFLLAPRRNMTAQQKLEHEPQLPYELNCTEDGEFRQRELFESDLYAKAKKIHQKTIHEHF